MPVLVFSYGSVPFERTFLFSLLAGFSEDKQVKLSTLSSTPKNNNLASHLLCGI